MIDKKAIKKIIASVFGLLCAAFLISIWWIEPVREQVWFIVPIFGLFRMIGGTWWKFIGRFLPPIVAAAAFYFFVGWSWWILAIVGAYMILKTLPFTLIGDSVHDSWLNWVWIWVLGYLNGIACITMGIPMGMIMTAVLISLVPCVVYGITGTLSNLPKTRNWFVWKLVEFCFGASSAVPIAMLIQRAGV